MNEQTITGAMELWTGVNPKERKVVDPPLWLKEPSNKKNNNKTTNE